jgi:hypothetical protein
VRTTAIVLPVTKIKFGIVGAGLGAGLAMIGVAIIATRTTVSERLDLEIHMLLLGLASGLILGWLMGPYPVAQRAPKSVWQPSYGLLRSGQALAGRSIAATLDVVTWPLAVQFQHRKTEEMYSSNDPHSEISCSRQLLSPSTT